MKKFSALIFIVAMMFSLVACGVNSDEDEILRGSRRFNKYAWKEVIIEKLQEIGVEEVKSVKTRDYDTVSFVYLETEKTKLEIFLSESSVDFDENGKTIHKWCVVNIKDANDREVVYYDSYEEKYEERYGLGKLPYDLYDYKTGEIIIFADAEAKEEEEEIRRANLERIQEGLKEKEKQEDEKSKVIIAEIYDAYQSNQLVADDKYKGNRYTITGVFETVEEDDLANVLFKKIGVTVTVQVDNRNYILWCEFDKSERENLKKYSKGDLIKFTGECVSWGNWIACKVE